MSSWPSGISAITLFVEDLAGTKAFYERAFGLPVHYEDEASAVFNFGNTLINLLVVTEAAGLIGPAPVAGPDAGARVQFTIEVDDVDATCADLAARGVELLNRPDGSAVGHPDGRLRAIPRGTSGRSRSRSSAGWARRARRDDAGRLSSAPWTSSAVSSAPSWSRASSSR